MIVVFGATGTVGRELLRLLRGRPVRAAWHARAPEGPVEAARVDLTTGEGLDGALRGAERVFLLCPSFDEQAPAERRVVDACVRAGVSRIVKLSVLAAEDAAHSYARAHRAGELAVESSGIAWTFLRPGSFMQNLSGLFGVSVRREGVIRLPCGDAKDAMVDARDIAAVAAAALTEDGHEGRAYDLIGDSLTYAECAAALTRALGRGVRYEAITDGAFRDDLMRLGMVEREAERVVELFRFVREGEFRMESDAVERVLGREAVSFERFARERAGAWR